jgi:hypothetical protein
MSTTDCSKNRFKTLDESQNKNPFMGKNESHFMGKNESHFMSKNESNESRYTKPASARWSNLSSGEEEEERTQSSPRNTFQQRRNNFGPDKDKHGNYRKSSFRKETRPKTPPPPTFDFKEGDFPSLG